MVCYRSLWMFLNIFEFVFILKLVNRFQDDELYLDQLFLFDVDNVGLLFGFGERLL